MMVLITCGATVGDISQEYLSWTGEPLHYEKLWPGDTRGAYGEYLIWLSPAQAQVVASRYSSVIRMVDDAASINEG